MKKRGGINISLQTIMTMIVIIAVLAGLLYLIVNNANGSLIKKQILAKKLCLLTTEAMPGTIINITSDVIIEKKEAGFLIKKDVLDVGYYYPCYNKNIELYREDKSAIIEIK